MELARLASETEAALASFDGNDEAVRRALARFRKALQLAQVSRTSSGANRHIERLRWTTVTHS